MRVLVAINQLSDFGGTQTYCVDLVQKLADSGHDVDVYCLYSAPVMTRGVEAAGARLYTYPSFPRSVPDRAIVMHPLATFMTLNRIPHSVPTMAIIHGIVPYEYPVRLSRIDAFVAVSPFIRDTLISRDRVGEHRITVIPNGIDIDKFGAPVVHRSVDTIRILWGSSHHALRDRAFQALVEAVHVVSATRLTVVEWNLQTTLVTGQARIDVVPKTADPRELIMQADVVCALGPGRIILEAVGMNRAAICLNTSGRGEYFTERNRMKLEYYLGDWGAPIEELLTPAQVSAHQNQRVVIERHYDRDMTLRDLVRQLEALEKRPSSQLDSALIDLRTGPLVMAEYARLLESRLDSSEPTHRLRSRAERSYAIVRRLLPHRVRARIARMRALQSAPQPPSPRLTLYGDPGARSSHDEKT